MFDAELKVSEAPLYRADYEHDGCGIGAVVNIKGNKSRETIENALKIVENLEHRAGRDAEGKTGDGVGILVQICHDFFTKVTRPLGIELGGEREYGVGMFFFPQDELKCNQAKKMFEIIVEKEGLEFLGWREVPCVASILGQKAVECMPCIMQAFVKKPANVDTGLAFDRKLYIIRRVYEQSSDNTYVVSLSSRTIVYKGMFLVTQLRTFFRDLQSEDYVSAIAMVHSRFSTNTNPSWERAHPNRFIVHNGEINTIRGNVDKMIAREENMESEFLCGEFHKVLPVVDTQGSDSAMLDNTLEFLVMSGMELPLAVMITIPEPWANNRTMSQTKKDFYQYYATMMEPWDGPASILFSDGDIMGAVLDRNGLRPSRYYITSDDQLILSSEVGVLPIDDAKIVKKDRLRPGKMLLVDTIKGELIDDDTLKEQYAKRRPYGEWLDSNLVTLKELKIPNVRVPEFAYEERQRMQKAFGYTYEELKTDILPMAKYGGESIGAMGVDTPIPALSRTHHQLSNYFKQQFAQVTNPPIDVIREKVVTATTVYIGKHGNILQDTEKNCNIFKVNNPILTTTDLLKIKNMKREGFQVEVIPIIYYKNTSLERAIDHLYVEVDRAYRDGVNIMILSDRGVDENHVAIPSLLAVSAIQKHLVRTKKRTGMALILESAEPREVHDFATLIGYGACAVNPYLAQESIKELIDDGMLDKDYHAAVDDYNDAILHGIMKIASKMGISTIQSYQGSQIFEAVGIASEVIDQYFTNTVCRIGGINLQDIEKKVDDLHSLAFDPLGLATDLTLDSLGQHKSRGGAEEHLYNPATIHLLQQATWQGDYEMFKQYSALLTSEDSKASGGCIRTIRGLMDFNYPEKGISIDEVESVESIVTRFKTGAMSYGSISKEAHETLAIAMNILHGKSNSGEGGEELERMVIGADGLNRCSAIKQVASGRFGVTSRYLVSAQEIQIKIAQGAKPGEGGHLPARKVYPWIAKTRHSTPGVGLISPPPQHDIYSIEDLAQLIYDLKNANRDARISVKLVSEAGVGTVAAGVVKAGAQVVLISGYDGGTGAAPKSSIYNAGLPWELGLAETHQTLIQNGLRNKVRLETDGKLMTGRDVAIAAILGAEEFGFGTAPLVTMGCVMMRVCNLDTCPVGLATQNPELRKRFKGKPEYVVNFMKFIAQELREYMALLGVKTVDDLVGHTDLLRMKEDLPEGVVALDLSRILKNPYQKEKAVFDPKQVYDFELENTLDEKVLIKQLGSALESKQTKTIDIQVTNTDRAFGTMFGSEITKRYYNTLEDDTYKVRCCGSGGQSFGAFIPNGLTLELAGDSNDYFGKGLSGGKLIVYPPKGSTFKQDENIIIGNGAFYGATSGKAFINGVAGERFCVRNSGVVAVVEGVGDHGCEYMTGGCVAVLGDTGKNFAAGMSGGIAYVLDEDNDLYIRVNKEMVSMSEITNKYDVIELKEMIREHVACTGSEKGRNILDNFGEYLPKFKKIIPHDYERMLKTIVEMEERGLSAEQARLSEALQAAQAANNSKTMFLSNMSHDIRTPMNAVLGFTSLLEKDAENPEKVREYTKKIMASGQHLLSLINDILDVSKIESGKVVLAIEEFTLNDLISSVDAIIRSMANAKEQTFHIEVRNIEHEYLQGDETRINQILINLLSNAVKYTPQGGNIWFRIIGLKQRSSEYEHIRMEVEDDGYGMTQEYLKTIFDAFTRAENSTTNKIQGTGLGMAITKNIVDLMGGTIEVFSEVDKGSLFRVELELRIPKEEAYKHFWKKNKIVRILAVTGNVEEGKNIQMLMQDLGVTVHTVHDQEEVMRLILDGGSEKAGYDVILLDGDTPEMDVAHMAKEIRNKLSDTVPILFLTAQGIEGMEDSIRVKNMGILSKPFLVSAFQEEISEIQARQEGEALQEPMEDGNLEGMHFLAAEDNDINADILREILSIEGADCEIVENGQLAVERFETAAEGEFDAILMDVQMPVMNGYEATRAIRALKRKDAGEIPIIAMTANAFTEDEKEALAAGMNVHMAKPIDIALFRKVIHQCINEKE